MIYLYGQNNSSVIKVQEAKMFFVEYFVQTYTQVYNCLI